MRPRPQMGAQVNLPRRPSGKGRGPMGVTGLMMLSVLVDTISEAIARLAAKWRHVHTLSP